MTFMIKTFYIFLLTLIGACAIYLMYGEIPAPTTHIEKILPNEMFFGKKKPDVHTSDNADSTTE